MKTFLLSASLVAAATVSAAELKDPAAVSQEWSQTAAQVVVARTDPTDLRALSPNPFVSPNSFSVAERTPNPVPAWQPEKEPSPYDIIIRPPDYDPKRIPKGAKPYEFNGKTYWLVPIIEQHVDA